MVTGVIMQGASDYNEYVTKFGFKYREDGAKWQTAVKDGSQVGGIKHNISLKHTDVTYYDAKVFLHPIDFVHFFSFLFFFPPPRPVICLLWLYYCMFQDATWYG